MTKQITRVAQLRCEYLSDLSSGPQKDGLNSGSLIDRGSSLSIPGTGTITLMDEWGWRGLFVQAGDGGGI